MKNFFVYLTLTFFSFSLNESFSASWCKAIYPFSKEAFDGNFQKQLSLCKNTDNVFISIHSQYDNALHLLHASIANFCDLTKHIIKSEGVICELNLETIGTPSTGRCRPTFILLSSKISLILFFSILIILQAKVDLVGAPYPKILPLLAVT